MRLHSPDTIYLCVIDILPRLSEPDFEAAHSSEAGHFVASVDGVAGIGYVLKPGEIADSTCVCPVASSWRLLTTETV